MSETLGLGQPEAIVPDDASDQQIAAAWKDILEPVKLEVTNADGEGGIILLKGPKDVLDDFASLGISVLTR